MDPFQVKRVKEEHGKGLHECLEKIRRWEKFKSDYEILKERLETLPDSLSYDVTIPFGTNAFTTGKIVHTNEIMVLLGDNWFAEVSAKEASAIANRRILQCSKMLEEFNKEKLQFENWLKYINEVSGDENLVEIIEKYDEEEERKWKAKHAENVKEYRRQQKTEEKNSEEDQGCNSEDGYIEKLNYLEISEADSNEVESDRNTTEYSDECSQNSEEHFKPPLKLLINCNNQKSFSESETGDDVEDNNKRINMEDLNANVTECSSPSASKHVRWVDLSKQNMKKITFKHSKSKKHNSSHSTKNQDSHSENEDHPFIQSPSDIYKYFGSYFQMSPPKSILKVKHSPTSDCSEPCFPTKENVSKSSSPDTNDESSYPAFTGQVIERSSPVKIIESKSRPSSHFKNSRKNRKR